MKYLKLTQKGIAHYVVPLLVVVAVTIGGVAYIAIDNAAACVTYEYGDGGSGSCVGYIQTLANWKPSVSPKLTVDDQFGSLTEAGIKQVQKTYSLTQDGIVGPNTWKALCSPTAAPGVDKAFSGAALTAYNNSGCSSIISDYSAPSPPSNLTVNSVNNKDVSLSWKASTDVVSIAGYHVYRNNSLIGTTTTQTIYTDLSVAPSTEYSYYVTAYNTAGYVSAPSNTVTVSTLK